MEVVIAFLASVLIIVVIVAIFLPVKCPKCGKKCKLNWYDSSISSSAYYECPDHGDIDSLSQKY